MRTTELLILCALPQLMVWAAPTRADEQASGYADPPMPTYRVEADGFGASAADIKAVCDSAGRELWRFFPDDEIEPFVVTRGKKGPIVLFQRNGNKEIVMRLDTQSTYWSQYAYQFAHEFCHILCRYDEDFTGHKWFEETLCETASLFAIRAMAKAWADDPPYSHWKDYRHALRSYADNVISKRSRVLEIYQHGLSGFYRRHQSELEQDSSLRELNGAMSLVFLRLFEENPARWGAIRWLNDRPSPPGETFQQYLQHWHDAVPAEYKPFVHQVADLYGIELAPAEAAPAASP